MPSARIRRLDPSDCDAMIRALGDTPETVIAAHRLRHGLCEAFAETGPDRHDAVVRRPSRPSDELMGYGQDVEAFGRALRGLFDWSCVCEEDDIARRLGPLMETRLGRPVRCLRDIYHSLEQPVVAGSHPSVRYLAGEDFELLASIRRPNHPRSILTPTDLEPLTAVGISARGECFRSMAKRCRLSKAHQAPRVIPWSGWATWQAMESLTGSDIGGPERGTSARRPRERPGR